MSEAETQRTLLAAIGAVPRLLVERMNTGVAKDIKTGRVVRFGTPGGPDIRVTLQGKSVAIECKSDRGTLSPEQRTWAKAFGLAGGEYIVCRDARQAVADLAALATGETRAALLSAASNLDLDKALP